jgi:hypothetical protein
MPFSRRFYPKRLTVMCAYILRMGGPGDPLKNPLWFQVEPFEFHVEPFTQRVLHGTQKSSTRNQTGFYLEPKRVLLWGQLKNPFGSLFWKSG